MGEKRKLTIDKIFNKTVASSNIHESILFVENTQGDFSYNKGYGGKDINSPFIMASVTKLFTTTCIIILKEAEKLSFSDKVSNYLDDSIMSGLHVYAGKEYSYELSISDLLFHVSGLPDEFEETNDIARLPFIENDSYQDFKDYVASVKKSKARFAPGTPRKAYYANINFDLLGLIIEKITQQPLEQVFNKMIFEPLGLRHTYLPTSEHEFIPNVYVKDQSLYRPQTIRSSRASGGCISTAYDLMIFMKAFFGGKLFAKTIFEKLSIYNKLQASKGPIYYGGGYMRIPLNGILTFFMGKGELLGHSGSTGSFAFYYPHKDLFIIGDVNQMAKPAIPIRLVIKLAMAIK